MKNLTKYLVFILAVFIGLPSYAQTIKIEKTSPKYPSSNVLPFFKRQQIVKTTEDLLNDYAKAAPLIDEKKRRVTGESINRFRALFNPSADIIKDYEENIQAELIDVRTYTEGVFQRLEYMGVKVRIERAELKEIIDDPAGFWVLVVDVEKSIYNAASADQGEKEFPSGRFMKQQFRFDISKTDLNHAKITGINRIGGQGIADKYVRYLGPSFGLNLPFFNTTMSSLWQSAHATSSSLDVNGDISFSGGFDFLTNRFYSSGAERKNLFLAVGLHFSYMQLTTELKDFSIAAFDETATDGDGNQTTYKRTVGSLQADEKLKIGFLEIPLGITYRLKKSIKSDIMLSVKLIPTLVLTGTGDVNGKGTYDASLDEADFRLLEPGAIDPGQIGNSDGFAPFKAGENIPIHETANPTLSDFLLSARVSPTVYIHLSEDNSSWSLLLALDLNFRFNSFLNHDNSNEEIFKFSDDFDTSILQHYTEDISTFSAGIRIGLHHRLTKKP